MSTVVFVHAHPDDEALLTGGTMAALSDRGHRVVLVTATDGAAGLAASDHGDSAELAAKRAAELFEASRILGVDAHYDLGYADSGLDGLAEPAAGRERLTSVPPEAAADRLAEVLAAERAVVVVGYDPSGGYGHPDHVRVHEFTRLAARATGIGLVEATLPREPLLRVVRLLRSLRWAVPALAGLDLSMWASAFTPRAKIHYRVDVRCCLTRKRAALAAHASQTTADQGPRTIGALLQLPAPAFRRLMGHEWYVAVSDTDRWGTVPATVAGVFGPPHRKGVL